MAALMVGPTHSYRCRPFDGSRRTACALILALPMALLACASSQRREAYIESRPPGAAVFVGEEEIGTTPLRTTLDFGTDGGEAGAVTIRVEMEGYRPQVRHVLYEGPRVVVFPLRSLEESPEDR